MLCSLILARATTSTPAIQVAGAFCQGRAILRGRWSLGSDSTSDESSGPGAVLPADSCFGFRRQVVRRGGLSLGRASTSNIFRRVSSNRCENGAGLPAFPVSFLAPEIEGRKLELENQEGEPETAKTKN